MLVAMTRYSPEKLGAIQARLAYLQLRKIALDELILSMERYCVYELPPARKPRREQSRQARTPHFAGAA
jgi:hypothetical protein